MIGGSLLGATGYFVGSRKEGDVIVEGDQYYDPPPSDDSGSENGMIEKTAISLAKGVTFVGLAGAGVYLTFRLIRGRNNVG